MELFPVLIMLEGKNKEKMQNHHNCYQKMSLKLTTLNLLALLKKNFTIPMD